MGARDQAWILLRVAPWCRWVHLPSGASGATAGLLGQTESGRATGTASLTESERSPRRLKLSCCILVAVSEESAVDGSAAPVTADSLAADLRRLGVRPGQTVLVHSSLSSLGWVCAGAVAVVEALLTALGPDSTLVAPTHTGNLSDPSGWTNPRVPESWWDTIRAHMPHHRRPPTR